MDFSTKSATNDNFTVKQILQQEDVGNFIQAMMKEVNSPKSWEHMSFTKHSTLPPGTKNTFIFGPLN